MFGSLSREVIYTDLPPILRAVGPPTCWVPAKTLGLFGKLRGKYRFHTTYRTQKETDSMSIAERSSLSQKETVYHDKTVHHGKKQSITERNSLSRKETVYHRMKMSTCSGIFEFNNESRQVRCIQNKFIVQWASAKMAGHKEKRV